MVIEKRQHSLQLSRIRAGQCVSIMGKLIQVTKVVEIDMSLIVDDRIAWRCLGGSEET